ncbi:hypothetical protein [Streptomyces sp. LaPpAH-108]|uniref:hypothetical protein n=1 Tax=Streptomyces sp. LaPpAH-108 TaxID=1155714 RepID=UPI000362AC05|nr:hypothetical protein [Streptomyces sp. LaPpAH-108]
MGEKPETGRKRVDLSVPQVAGSALAAVVAAKLASYFGVYGTILGAGVVSVVATCGGSVFQQVFRRTGEQLREVKTNGRPRPQTAGEAAAVPGQFGTGTVYRARVKSWKRPLVAAALVFGVTMAGITVYELVSGSSFSGGKGTTVSDAVGGRNASHHKSPAPTPSWTPSTGTDPASPDETAPSGDGGTTGSATPEPSRSPDRQRKQDTESSPQETTPAPTTDAPTASPTPRESAGSSRSGTVVPDQGGSAAP